MSCCAAAAICTLSARPDGDGDGVKDASTSNISLRQGDVIFFDSERYDCYVHYVEKPKEKPLFVPMALEIVLLDVQSD